MTLAATLSRLLAAGTQTAKVRIARAAGSTPRETGTAMLVTHGAAFGTVGGGRLEWDAAARARALLASDESFATLEVPLGPAIGQCCGGHVALAITRADADTLARLQAAEAAEHAARPRALLFGAGHVGHAIAHALAPLPLAVRWIDGRDDAFGPDIPAGVIAVASGWQDELDSAPAGTSCLVLTHSHALDSVITAAALERDDFAYVGLIGSRSKRRRFEHGFRDAGLSVAQISRLVCPIGAGVRDKRPAVIACFAAAEVLRAALSWQAVRTDIVPMQRRAS